MAAADRAKLGAMMCGSRNGKERTSFFAKKEAKKLLLVKPTPHQPLLTQIKKVFCFFFTKKKSFPILLFLAIPRHQRP
ncbi:MAG: hypothetical protein PHI71_18025 [Acidiphilium sp.]|jgi:hypothetical protein|nr:hypothetical protein [Acidiphilium sp.]